jgi:hypothetical protein
MLRFAAGPAAAVLTVLLTSLLTMSAAAQDVPEEAGEYNIKAAYLYKLLSFVSWPEALDGPSGSSFGPSICILGNDPFADAFAKVEDQPWGLSGRRLRINRLGRFRQSTDLSGCHILFISANEKHQLAAILKEIEDAPTLTVADMEGFLEGGGMIQLVKLGDRKNGYYVNSRINMIPIEEAGLEPDPQLLALAAEVLWIPQVNEAPASLQSSDKNGQPQ